MRPIIYWNCKNSPPPFIVSISQELEIPIMDQAISDQGYLCWEKERLVYKSVLSIQEKFSPIYFDFIKYWKHHKRQKYSLKKEPLAKAMGINKEKRLTVWDVTCGSGKDSILMIFFGVNVIAFERSPIIAALISDALRRATQDSELNQVLQEKFQFFPFDPRDGGNFEKIKPDVIYLDPMYGDNIENRKTKPRKEMRIFLEVVGNDPDAKELFHWACEFASKRIVVKRSLHAKELIDGVSVQYKGKSTRYDMYSMNKQTMQRVNNSTIL